MWNVPEYCRVFLCFWPAKNWINKVGFGLKLRERIKNTLFHILPQVELEQLESLLLRLNHHHTERS